MTLFERLPPLSEQEQGTLIQIITPLQDDLEILATHLRQWISKKPDLDQPLKEHAAGLILGKATLKDSSSQQSQIPISSTTKERLIHAIQKQHI